MIKEALQYIASLGVATRMPIQGVGDGSERLYLYNDGQQKYEPVERFVKRQRTVSNIESFAAMVKEEARRAGVDGQEDLSASIVRGAGDRMTVIFDKTGAHFHLDDRDGRYVFRYQREISWQWTALQEAAQPVEHLAFIRTLQRLRPTIQDYVKVLTEFRKVSFTAHTQVESAPTLEQGKAGVVHRLEFTAKNGKNQADLPSTIHCILPFAQGSKKLFEADVEVAIELHEPSKKVRFSLAFADAFALTEQAISHEVEWFREQVADLTLLSILEDY